MERDEDGEKRKRERERERGVRAAITSDCMRPTAAGSQN